MLVVHLLKAKKELNNLCRREIQTLLTKIILIMFVFNMIKSKNLVRGTESDNVLRDKVFEVASNQKYD